MYINKMSKAYKLRFFYKESDRIHYIESYGDTLYEDSVRIMRQAEEEIHYYECYKGYTKDVVSLMQFRTDFLKWSDELAPLTDYRKYFCNTDAVINTFKRFSTRQLNSIQIDRITFDEMAYMESTNNGGWIKLNEKYKNKTVQTYGYDQTSFYPHLLGMSDFQFPIKQGTEYFIEELDFNDLYYGIYRVDIQCTHPDFCNMFVFSKTGYYTHFDLQFAHRYVKKYAVSIQLNVKCDYNTLLYEKSDLIESKFIFNNWYTSLARAKKTFKKNKVVKHLLSSVLGHLIRFKQIKSDSEEDFENLDISRMNNPDHTKFKLLDMTEYPCNNEKGYRTLYTYIESAQPYNNDLARMKPFFMSYSRIFMAKLLVSEGLIGKFVRSHTDNICLTEPHDFTHLPYYPKEEEKTTGNITWIHVNKYSCSE